MKKKAILIGNSDGIGLAATNKLLAEGWEVTGISRSKSSITSKYYKHKICDVSGNNYTGLLNKLLLENTYNLCIYFAGIGEMLDPLNMDTEPVIIDVNLTGMVRTASKIIPQMVRKGSGHFIGISSMADELLSAEAPSYHASKAGFSNYLEGLALALKPRGVHVTNIRFGFVDTKMAKGDIKPFMISTKKAIGHLENCIRKRPVRYTAPKAMVPLIKFRKIMMGLGSR